MSITGICWTRRLRDAGDSRSHASLLSVARQLRDTGAALSANRGTAVAGGGFGSLVLVSLIAVVCLDYFFTPPILQLEVFSTIDAAALVTYLVTSLVITRLASEARQKHGRRKSARRL